MGGMTTHRNLASKKEVEAEDKGANARSAAGYGGDQDMDKIVGA